MASLRDFECAWDASKDPQNRQRCARCTSRTVLWILTQQARMQSESQ